jgi:hypothetical protein
MGIYYSEDGRYCTSTLDYPPVTFLSDKGLKDTDTAIIIQRWWRRINKQTSLSCSDTESYMADNSDNNSFECVRRSSYKRKLDEMTDLDSDLDVEEINSSEFSSESLSQEYELQTLVDNSFLWDFWLSFYNFVWKVLGY